MNQEDSKNQLQSFGFIVRDEAFFKKSQQVIDSFKIKANIEIALEEE